MPALWGAFGDLDARLFGAVIGGAEACGGGIGRGGAPQPDAPATQPPQGVANLSSTGLGDLSMLGALQQTTAKETHVLDKTRLCKFFRKGQCTRGEACTFAHGRRQLRPQPNLYRTQPCIDFLKTGGCSFGDGCRYAHHLEEVRPVRFMVLPGPPEPAGRGRGAGPARRGGAPAEPPGAQAARAEPRASAGEAMPEADSVARELELVKERARSLQAQLAALEVGRGEEGLSRQASGEDKRSGRERNSLTAADWSSEEGCELPGPGGRSFDVMGVVAGSAAWPLHEAAPRTLPDAVRGHAPPPGSELWM